MRMAMQFKYKNVPISFQINRNCDNNRLIIQFLIIQSMQAKIHSKCFRYLFSCKQSEYLIQIQTYLIIIIIGKAFDKQNQKMF